MNVRGATVERLVSISVSSPGLILLLLMLRGVLIAPFRNAVDALYCGRHIYGQLAPLINGKVPCP